MKKLLKFYTKSCGPCQALSMSLLDVDMTGVDLIEVDVDQAPEFAQKYNVRGVPTLVLEDEGIEIRRIVGNKSVAELQKFVE